MNVQTKRWARPLALFIALTMVMMYSFGGAVFAGNDDKVHVHYTTETKSDELVIKTTIEGIQYTSTILVTKNGELFKGFLSLPEGFKGKLDTNNTIVLRYISGISEPEVLTITPTSADGEGVLNIWIAGTIVTPVYDLKITKVAEEDKVELNETVKFTITVKNIGTGDVSDVVVTDEIPEGLSITAITTENGEIVGDEWKIGNLVQGQSVTLQVEAVALELGFITNTATVDFEGTDADEDNNTASATIEVVAAYDLKLLKSVAPESVGINEEAIFTITVKNNGQYNVSGVVVKDIWPAGLDLVTATSTESIQFNETDMTWLIGDLAKGETKTITLSGISNEAAVYNNSASVTFSGIDQNPDDNSDSATLEVLLEKDLGITKIAAPSSILLNGSTLFTVTITNNGTDTINNIFVKDVMETGLSVSAIGSEDFEDGIWKVGTLASGQSETLTIAAIGTVVGSLENSVEIVTQQILEDQETVYVAFIDEDLDNNTAEAIVTVTNPTNNEEDDDEDTPSGTGGGGGGGTTIQETTPPLTNIPDGETPMVEAPEVTLEEQPIPMADVPQTGDNTNIWLLLALMMGSGAGIVLLGRRKVTVEK